MNVLVACEESQTVTKKLRRKGHRAFSCDIQKCSGGHPFTKATCLWLKGLEPLTPFVTEKPANCKSYAWETMIDERGKTISWNSELSRKLRSKTFDGVAEAMVEQWF